MEYLIGLVLALAVAGFAAITGFERDRVFYPTVLIIVAHYYVLFAVIGASGQTLAIEIAVASAFLLIAILGFKRNLWLVAAAIAGHGVFDFFHHSLIENPGVPRWWPGFCLAFDVGFRAAVSRLRSRFFSDQPISPRLPKYFPPHEPQTNATREGNDLATGHSCTRFPAMVLECWHYRRKELTSAMLLLG